MVLYVGEVRTAIALEKLWHGCDEVLLVSKIEVVAGGIRHHPAMDGLIRWKRDQKYSCMYEAHFIVSHRKNRSRMNGAGAPRTLDCLGYADDCS